jgi:ABC-2 type transport system permease protein
MRILTLLATYLRIAVSNELQYRLNLYLQLGQSAIALLVGLLGLQLVFSQTTDLAGWSASELLVVMGVYMLMGGVIRAYIQPNMLRLMEEIQQGSLDFALTRPVDGQVVVSLREFHFWSLVDFVLGLLVVAVGVSRSQAQVGLWQGLAFVAALLLGAVILYCFWLILSASAFWIIRVGEVAELFEGVYAAGRWPVRIYPRWLRLSLTFLIPVAFAVTIPAEALTGRLTPQALLGTFGLALVFMALARLVWRLGVKQYSGASA